MKKVLFMMTAVLGLSLTFASCGGETGGTGTGNGENPTTVTSLQVVPAELTMVLDDEPTRLSYTTEPAGAKVTIVWSSSDEAVATVSDNGTVTPTGSGTATITATVKDTEVKGVCQVTVSSLEDQLNFVEASLGISAKSDETYTFEHNSLGTIIAHVALGRVQLFTEGLYFNASGQMDGAQQGGYIYMTTPFAVAYADENPDNPKMEQFPNGVSFSLGDFTIANSDKVVMKEFTMKNSEGQEVTVELPVLKSDETTPATHLIIPTEVKNDVFMQYMTAWITDFNEKGGFTQENYQNFAYAGIEGIVGPSLTLVQYTVDEEGEGEYDGYPTWLWNYTPNGIVLGGELEIDGNPGSSEFMDLIDYMNIDIQFVESDTCGIPGVYATFDPEKGYTITSTGVELGEVRNYTRGTKPANKPARMHQGLNIFVNRALTMENSPVLPMRETKHMVDPKQKNLK